MRQVHHQQGAGPVRDAAEPREIERPGISGSAGDDQPGMNGQGLLFQRVIIDRFGRRIQAVGSKMEILAGNIDRTAVGQMAAGVQVHTQHRIARRKQREIDRHIGL